MSERNVKLQCIKWLRDTGWYVIPIQDRYRAGTLDIYCCKASNSLWVEFKRPGGIVSVLQQKEIMALSDHCVKAVVVHSLDELKKEIYAWLYSERGLK